MLRNKLESSSLNTTPEIHLSLPPAAKDSAPQAPGNSGSKRTYRRNILIWFALMAALLLAGGYFAYRNANGFISDVEDVERTNQVLNALTDSFSALKDVESGGRGYVLSGQQEYLEPTYVARQQVFTNLQTLRRLTGDDPRQQKRIAELEQRINEKLEFNDSVVSMRRREDFDAVRRLALSGAGKQKMDEVRALITDMEGEERRLLEARKVAAYNSAQVTTIFTILGVCFSFSILSFVYFMIRREHMSRLAVERGLEQSNAKLQRGLADLEQLTHEMNLAETMGELLQSCLTFSEMSEVIKKAVPQLLPGTTGALCTINSSKNFVETAITWGEGVTHESTFTPDECWALRRGGLHFAANPTSAPACEHVKCSAPHGYLCIPLLAHGETLGVLHLCATEPSAINDSKQHIIRNISEQFSLTLANLRLQQTLRTQSIHDPLTGLFNRRYMEVSLEREMLRARRHETPLGVVMLDIDHFKRFNDTFGHGAGDMMLQEMGSVLRSCARGEDIVCRYGGEEFLVILPGATTEVARHCARRISEAVKSIRVEFHGQRLGALTVSLGVAAYPENADLPEELIRLADTALYRAKRSGRDRVVVAGQDADFNQSVVAQADASQRVIPFTAGRNPL
ncbi:MAG: GGDEF domain-containing protein [Acidobacteriota bacterium]|nr:GGDEF domain-containing protein [Acidobacteriota bacterium]